MRTTGLFVATAAVVASATAEVLPATYDEITFEQTAGVNQYEWEIPAFPDSEVYFRPRELMLYNGATLSVYNCNDMSSPKRVFDYNDRKRFVVSDDGCLKVVFDAGTSSSLSKVVFMYHSRSRNYRNEDMPCTLAPSGEKACMRYSARRVAKGYGPCEYYEETRYRAGQGMRPIGCEEPEYCEVDNYQFCDDSPYCERAGGLCFNKPAPMVEKVANCVKAGRPEEECDPDYCNYFEFVLPNNKNSYGIHKVNYGCQDIDFCEFEKVPNSYKNVPLVAQELQCNMRSSHCHWDAAAEKCLLITEMPTISPTNSPTTLSPTTAPTVSPTQTPTQTPTASPEESLVIAP